MTRWLADDVRFLREHYPSQGPAWVARQLGRCRHAVAAKASDLRIAGPGPDPEATYRGTLAAIRADLAAHGSASPRRVAEAMGLSLSTIEKRFTEARKRGDIDRGPASTRSSPAVVAYREPDREYRAGVEARIAEASRRKQAEAPPGRWSVPVVVDRRNRG